MKPEADQLRRDLEHIAERLRLLLAELEENWRHFEPHLSHLPSSERRSAQNLIHYLTLRRNDIRLLQEELARHGLSSLGRAESHVTSGITSILDLLHTLVTNECPAKTDTDPPLTLDEGRDLLRRRTRALLGSRPETREVRIMVTLPTAAADDYELVRQLLLGGMDCARINCAHDDVDAWSRMIENVRRSSTDVDRKCRIAMDIAGPKLRTGSIVEGPRALTISPEKSPLGIIEKPARVYLFPEGSGFKSPDDGFALPLSADFLSTLASGTRLEFRDAANRKRSFDVQRRIGDAFLATSLKTAYVKTGTKLIAPDGRTVEIGMLPAIQNQLFLRRGDTLIITRAQDPGRPALLDESERILEPARISCTLPEVFDDLRAGERILFADGKMGGVIKTVGPEEIEVEITTAKIAGQKLKADKGINLPDSNLSLPALTDKDLEDLKFIVANADIVSYSFVRTGANVRDLQRTLAELGGEDLGVILKIETRKAFEQLPDIILSSLRSRAVGVMIARGDLAVEAGWERMAEVQEQIMWLCEAAHMPVIWATQVLEQLSKKGIPSRAEITDAAMSERAECVMLNKGPFVVEAVQTLDGILTRMQSHQEKKRSMLRKLNLADEFFVRHEGIEYRPI